jgi:rod shape-determining protein MreD
MSATDWAKVSVAVFVASIVQVSVLNGIVILGVSPDLLLPLVVAVALLRGSVAGAAAGFAAGLLVDVATLSTLGVTSLVLTLSGYWVGRYGETTGRDRGHAPAVALAVVTVLAAVGAYVLHYLLGESVSAHEDLVSVIPPSVLLNVVIGIPVYLGCRRLLRPRPAVRADGVEIVV